MAGNFHSGISNEYILLAFEWIPHVKYEKSLLNNASFIAFFTTYLVPKTTPTLTFLLIFNEESLFILSEYDMFWLSYESFSISCFFFFFAKKGSSAKIAVLALHKNYLNGIWKELLPQHYRVVQGFLSRACLRWIWSLVQKSTRKC